MHCMGDVRTPQVSDVVLRVSKPGTHSQTLSLYMSGTAERAAHWSVAASSVPPWLTLDRTSGVVGAGQSELQLCTVTADAMPTFVAERAESYGA